MKASNKRLIEISNENMRSEIVEPIYNTDQLMELLKVSRKTLQKWRDTGVIIFSQIGSKCYYRHSDVIAMLNFFKINN